MLLALSFLESVESLYSSFGACPPCAVSEAAPERNAFELQPRTHRKQASAADAMKSFMVVCPRKRTLSVLVSKELYGGRDKPARQGRNVGCSKSHLGLQNDRR